MLQHQRALVAERLLYRCTKELPRAPQRADLAAMDADLVESDACMDRMEHGPGVHRPPDDSEVDAMMQDRAASSFSSTASFAEGLSSAQAC